MPVTRGDILAIDDAWALTEKEVHVVWQQYWTSRSQDYYLVTYTNTTRATEAEHSGLLFIQKNMLDAFKAKQIAGQKEITFKIDDSFQYGEARREEKRWIAFHDKSQKMFQHRFIENTLLNFADMASTRIPELLGVPSSYNPAPAIKGFISDYTGDLLHNF